MRAPEHAIPAPPFPRGLPWVGVAPLRMDKQRGRPVLIEFWDFCRVNSLRTLPYLTAWHERYADAGLRVIGVHTGGFAPARDHRERRRGRRAARHPLSGRHRRVAGDLGPVRQRGLARALPLGPARARCTRMHYGEGGYGDTEREIQALLGVEAEVLGAAAPRGRRGRAAPGPDRRPARRVLRPLRGRRRLGGAGGRGRGRRQRPQRRGHRAGLLRARRAPPPHGGRARRSSWAPA